MEDSATVDYRRLMATDMKRFIAEQRQKKVATSLKKARVTQSTSQLEHMDNSAVQALDFRSESRTSAQSSVSALHNTTAQICPSARAKIEELQRELSLARAKEADDGAALHKLKIELQTVKTKRDNEMEELRLTVKKLQALIDAKNCNPQRMRELEAEVEEMRIAKRSDMARIDDLVEMEKRARLQRDKLDVELKAALDEKSTIEAKLHPIQQQLELVQTDLKNTQAELEVMKQKYAKQNELRQSELEELSQMRADAAKAKSELAAWRVNNARAVAEKARLDELDKLRAEVERLTKLCQRYKFERENDILLEQQRQLLEEQLKHSKELHQKTLDELAAVKMRLLSEYRHDIKSDTSLIDRLTAELGRAHADIIALRNGNEEETIVDLRNKLNDALVQIASLKESGVPLPSPGQSDETEVVHMVDNPLNTAATEYAQSLSALTKENERLRERVELLEALGSEASSADVSALVSDRLNANEKQREVDELMRRLQEMERRMDRARQFHKLLAQQYRKTCSEVTGYNVKMKGNGEENIFEVQSTLEIGAKDDQCFVFQRNDDGSLSLLSNAYAERWNDFGEMYLQSDNCIPAYLAAVTLQLHSANIDDRSMRAGDNTTSTMDYVPEGDTSLDQHEPSTSMSGLQAASQHSRKPLASIMHRATGNDSETSSRASGAISRSSTSSRASSRSSKYAAMPHDRSELDTGDDADTTLRAPLQQEYERGCDEESDDESDYTSDDEDDEAPPPQKMAKTISAQRRSAEESDSSIECIE